MRFKEPSKNKPSAFQSWVLSDFWLIHLLEVGLLPGIFSIWFFIFQMLDIIPGPHNLSSEWILSLAKNNWLTGFICLIGTIGWILWVKILNDAIDLEHFLWRKRSKLSSLVRDIIEISGWSKFYLSIFYFFLSLTLMARGISEQVMILTYMVMVSLAGKIILDFIRFFSISLFLRKLEKNH